MTSESQPRISSSVPRPLPEKRPSFRRVSLRGLAVLLPSVLTLWILWYAFIFVFKNVAEPINGGMRAGITALVPRVVSKDQWPEWYAVTPEQLSQFKSSAAAGGGGLSDQAALIQARALGLERYWAERWYLQAAGLLVAVTLIYLAGALVGGFLGRRVYSIIERVIAKIPGFKQVYPYVKQVVDLMLGEKAMAFNRVVLVEFPRPGSWVVAFVTSAGLKRAEGLLEGDALTVFVPNTPTPFTGFTVIVRKEDVIDLPISVDEALRFVITGGVLVPGSQQALTAAGVPGAKSGSAV